MHDYARVCQSMPEYLRVCQSMSDRDQRDSRFSRILENFFSFSLLVLDLEPFQFHFHFSKKSEGTLFFTFHFSKKVKAIRISLFFLEKKSEIRCGVYPHLYLCSQGHHQLSGKSDENKSI